MGRADLQSVCAETSGGQNVMHKSPNETTLTIDQVAAILRVNERTVRRLRDAGRITGIKLGHRTVRFDRREIDRYLRGESK